jgi:hypothetical protein
MAFCQQAIAADENERTLKTKPITYEPFLDGYDYMIDVDQLAMQTSKGDIKAIRTHAWKLWAGIMQPLKNSTWPIWYSWPNTQQAFEKAKVGPLGSSKNKVDKHSLKKGETIKSRNKKNVEKRFKHSVMTPAPNYKLPSFIIDNFYKALCLTSKNVVSICNGKHFLNNGDILIAAESLSSEAMDNIRTKELYLKSEIDSLQKDIEVTQQFIVTKHMYWPVKASGVTLIPVWKNNFKDSFYGYAGYEKWDTFIALQPDKPQLIGRNATGKFLFGVYNNRGDELLPTITKTAKVENINHFYYHKVTQIDWDSFSLEDKAIITASSLWANNKVFEVGDYLVSIAMHVNTKEIPSWTLQSVWWSENPNKGSYARNRPFLPNAKGPWGHYLLTDSYDIPAIDGMLKKAVNPYIEGVIHPIATNCRNCHVRAGVKDTGYQNKNCPDLLKDINPNDECLKGIVRSDFLWIIPDRAH